MSVQQHIGVAKFIFSFVTSVELRNVVYLITGLLNDFTEVLGTSSYVVGKKYKFEYLCVRTPSNFYGLTRTRTLQLQIHHTKRHETKLPNERQ
jgi:hypothetical protein